MFFLIFLVLFFTGCDHQKNKIEHSISYEFSGRDEKEIPLYRIKANKNWVVKTKGLQADLSDTKKPLIEFTIQEKDKNIHITIHNFPSKHKGTLIPPSAQIFRWKSQFEMLDASTISEKPQNFAGYTGLLFEASGIINKKETSILAWSLQIGKNHYDVLESENKRGDCTIKAIGDTSLIKKHKKEIISFARSFELIDEIRHD